MELKNNSAGQVLVKLDAATPKGFQVVFAENYGDKELSTIPIEGSYEISVVAKSQSAEAETKLSMEIKGQPELNIAGPDGRLSGAAVAGRDTVFDLTLKNSGSAAAMTTTILMLLGLTEPTSGSVDIWGFDPLCSPLAIKRRVAYMPDTIGFYDELSAFENLDGRLLACGAVNSEFQKKTPGRILSQPIYRDALLFGKALGALTALAIVLLALWLLVIGSTMLFLGIPPSAEQVDRALSFYVLTLLYAAVWFVLAMLFSVLFRQPATSALVSIALWLLFTVFWPLITSIVTQALPCSIRRRGPWGR